MIIVNGLKFVKNDSQAIDTLFTDKTFSGFYKVSKTGVRLYNLQNELIAFCRRKDPMLLSARKLENGKTWYSYLSTSTEKFLNITSHQHDLETVQSILNQTTTN